MAISERIDHLLGLAMACAIGHTPHIERLGVRGKRRQRCGDEWMMKRGFVAIVAMGLALSACAGIREHRGFVIDKEIADGLQVGVDNKDSVTKALGRPTFTGQFNPNDWYYVSRDTAQLAFRDPRVTEQTVLRLSFDAAGNLTQIDRSGKEQIASVDPVGDKTPTLGRKKSFFSELFGNIGSIAQPGLPGSQQQ
jgi:outer membrane protein assembly factor BamE (lipoprotein component of BamABCDE complex)